MAKSEHIEFDTKMTGILGGVCVEKTDRSLVVNKGFDIDGDSPRVRFAASFLENISSKDKQKIMNAGIEAFYEEYYRVVKK